jgi:hypothetical protein
MRENHAIRNASATLVKPCALTNMLRQSIINPNPTHIQPNRREPPLRAALPRLQIFKEQASERLTPANLPHYDERAKRMF